MRVFLVLLFGSIASSAFATQVWTCHGHHELKVDWVGSLLTVDGTTYQMQKDRNGKKGKNGATLRGHDMLYIHFKDPGGGGHNVLELNGGHEIYHCKPSDEDDSAARHNAIAYRPNKFVEDAPDAANDPVHGTNASSRGGHGRAK
jgi:hypothetical protein